MTLGGGPSVTGKSDFGGLANLLHGLISSCLHRKVEVLISKRQETPLNASSSTYDVRKKKMAIGKSTNFPFLFPWIEPFW